MIYWCLQSSSDNLGIAHGIPPDGLLSEGEEAYFVELQSDRRRSDWLLGRWTAKQLLQAVIMESSGIHLQLCEISIYNDDQGAPYSVYTVPQCNHVSSLSISHSKEIGFCAVVERSSWPIGADIEQIDEQDESFVSRFFTRPEIDLLERAPTWKLATLVTATWCAKEAALKSLGLGLTADTRSVTCLVDPLPDSPRAWASFSIQWEKTHLGRPTPPLNGWWRKIGDFVLTLATGEAVDLFPSEDGLVGGVDFKPL